MFFVLVFLAKNIFEGESPFAYASLAYMTPFLLGPCTRPRPRPAGPGRPRRGARWACRGRPPGTSPPAPPRRAGWGARPRGCGPCPHCVTPATSAPSQRSIYYFVNLTVTRHLRLIHYACLLDLYMYLFYTITNSPEVSI